MTDLKWVRDGNSHIAYVVGGKYLVQPELILTKGRQRYDAMFVGMPGPLIGFGYHTDPAQGMQECQNHYDRRSAWDEDIEAGAIGGR